MLDRKQLVVQKARARPRAAMPATALTPLERAALEVFAAPAAELSVSFE